MANITQDSFSAYAYPRFQNALSSSTPPGGGDPGPFTKVLFQRGMDVRDSELNEFQDILRVFSLTSFYAGMQETTPPAGSFNPGSNDLGFYCLGTGADNTVTLQPGFLFCDGIPLELTTAFVFDGVGTYGGAGNATYTVYLAVTEVEVADPSVTPQLGPTTTRRQVQISVDVSTTGPSGVPANSSAPIWQGGVHYFPIANIIRRSGIPAIAEADVADIRGKLPTKLVAGRFGTTVGDGTTSVGEFTGPHSIQFAIAAALAAGATSIHILANPGSAYVVNNANPINTPNTIAVTIEGSSLNSVEIKVDSTGVSPWIAAGPFTFKNLALIQTAGTLPGLTTTSTLAFDSVAMEMTVGISSTAALSPILVSRNQCLFAPFVPGPIFSVSVPLASSLTDILGKISLVDTILETEGGPVVQLQPIANGFCAIEAVEFVRCTGLWDPTATVVSGCVSFNSTALDLNPAGFAASLVVRRVVMQDCDWTCPAGSAGQIAQVIRIVPFQLGDTASPPANGVVAIDEVDIRGGVWSCGTIIQALNPFTIVAAKVRIKGLHYVANGLSNGAWSEDVGVWIMGTTYTSVPFYGSQVLLSDTGSNLVGTPTAVAPSSTGINGLDIRDFSISGCPRANPSNTTITQRDVMILSAYGCKGIVDGLTLQQYIDTGTYAPVCRVNFTGFGSSGQFVVRNVLLAIQNTIAGHDWIDNTQSSPTQQGFIFLGSKVTLERASCVGPSVGGNPSPHCGIQMGLDLIWGEIGNTYPQDIRAVDCEMGNFQYGLRADVSGTVSDCHVIEGRYNGNSDGGILWSFATAEGVAQFFSCRGVEASENGGYGISLTGACTGGSTQSLEITDCICSSNSVGMISVVMTNTPTIVGTIIGNSGGSGAQASINVVLNGAGPNNLNIKGIETHDSYAAGAPQWTPNAAMLHNNAGLTT